MAEHTKNSYVHTYKRQQRNLPSLPWSDATAQFVDEFEMISTDHVTFLRDKSRRIDGGGYWFMDKTSHIIRPVMYNDTKMRGPVVYDEPSVISTTLGSISGIQALPSESSLKGLGTTAISRTLPNNSAADLSVFLGDLRQGVPRSVGSGILKERSNFLKGSASEYLNVEFGWKPLVSDLRSFAHAVKNSHEIIDSYKKGSDKRIRRRYAFPPKSEIESKTGITTGTSVTGYSADSTSLRTRETASWFSGAFRYHIPVSGTAGDRLAQHLSYADKLLGLRLTPDVVWELAPWTWAADWFANTGDVLHNVSKMGQDGLLLEYGYMMSQSLENVQVTSVSKKTGGQGYYQQDRKICVRLPSSPYGFALAWDGFSDRQLAIAAAVGITRL